MAFTAPTAEQLALYLNLPEIQGDRADLLIAQAVALCETVVQPLPEQATAVVLSAAGRAYINPTQVQYETIGPMSVQRPQAGLYLTKAEKSALKSMAGRGGAFTVDPTPTTADPSPTWPYDEDMDGWAFADDPGWV